MYCPLKEITTFILSLVLLLISQGTAHAQYSPISSDELIGLWKAKHSYGNENRGPLIIRKSGDAWFVDFMGRAIQGSQKSGVVMFELSERQAAVRAVLHPGGTIKKGQWLQLKPRLSLPFAASLNFKSVGLDRWQADVIPPDDSLTFYLKVEKSADGSLRAFLRNPERNLGLRYKGDRLVVEGNNVQLVGRRGQNANAALVKGVFNRKADTLTLDFEPPLDGPYEFKRTGDESTFYPRAKNLGRYSYHPPLNRGDGLLVGRVDEVGIDRRGVENFIQMLLDMPMDSVDSMQVDSILISRHGKLVLEEYFHGFDHDTLHPSRSAGKSLTAMLIGAALHAKLPVSLSMPVYQVMNGGSFPAGLEDRKRAMTLEHLLTMTSGIFCDDGNPDAPGNEEAMINQDAEPDYYRFSMRAPMDRQPGAEAVYCSGDPNLALGVLAGATGEHPMDLFDRLIGAPLRITRHEWYITPSRQPYGGGSVAITPRDYLKLGQLMLNQGTWKGHRILSEQFVKRSSAPLHDLNNIKYGYLWWILDWPFKERTVQAYFAGGNGGQGIIVIPELDIVIAINGSSYGNNVGLEIQQGLTPRYILPAVREKGDANTTPVLPREYKVIYGRKPRR